MSKGQCVEGRSACPRMASTDSLREEVPEDHIFTWWIPSVAGDFSGGLVLSHDSGKAWGGVCASLPDLAQLQGPQKCPQLKHERD